MTFRVFFSLYRRFDQLLTNYLVIAVDYFSVWYYIFLLVKIKRDEICVQKRRTNTAHI